MGDSIRIGPGAPCRGCGRDYGMHAKGCPVEHKRLLDEKERFHDLGQEFADALKAEDYEKVGRLLEGRTAL